MEAAKIDWQSLQSVFILDQVYENINAPQWVDFLALDRHSQDDEAWFCRPDCKHPKSAEDFLKSTPTSKLLRSVSVSKLSDWTRRGGNLKRRGQIQGQSCATDSENQNPNFSTPNRAIKAGFKSSAHKGSEDEDEYREILLHHSDGKPKPKLRSTQSARDLFGGRDIFNKISELCNELKKMTSWGREVEVEVEEARKCDQSPRRDVLGSHSKSERKPFLEVSKERYVAGGDKTSAANKKKLRKKKIVDDDGDDAENVPVSLNLNIKEEERLFPIRTNPPTPQGFSAKATTKSRLMEMEKNKTLREELGEKSHSHMKKAPAAAASPMSGTEGRALDVFWFLKPCTLSS